MFVDLIPATYSPRQDAIIKVEVVSDKPTNKHPDARGFICITRDWAERLVKAMMDAEAKGEHVAFLNVALWETAGQYGYTGKVTASLDTGRYDVPDAPVDKPTQSDWY